MELIARDAGIGFLAEFADFADQAAELVVACDRLADGGVGDVHAVLLVQGLEDMVGALEHSEVHIVVGVLEGDLHVLMEDDVHGAGVGCEEADGYAVAEVQQGFGDVLAGVGHADLPLLLGLGHQFVVGRLQEVFKIGQILQVSHCVCSFPLYYQVIAEKADVLRL